jgi:hypothetical protein
MSAVILRCDNCGTAQSKTGLCEACHEGQVRYYCINHEPGRWLDGPKCTHCGAEYGVTVASPSARQSTGPIRKSREPRPSSRVPPRTTSLPPKRSGGPWDPKPSVDESLVREDLAARRRALETLRHILRGGFRGRAPDPTDFAYDSPTPRMAEGCLRVVMLIMLFFLLLSFLGSNFGALMLGY